MKTSVALCTYNGERFLKEQIDSILDQTIPVDEIVVCDDGSTDSTISILNNYSEKFPNIFKIHQNEKNLKSVKNFEKAISLCTNDIIFLSDQDDVWLENKVETIVDYFNSHPNISAISTGAYCIDGDNKIIQSRNLWEIPQKSNKNYFELITLHQNFVTGATMGIKKSIKDMAIPFPENFHHDEWIAIITSSCNKLHFLNKKLVRYRVHKDQQVGSVLLSEKEFKLKLTKINTSKDKLTPKELLSNLKRIKRKIENAQDTKERCEKFFFTLKKEQKDLIDIAKKKYFVRYYLYYLLKKI